MTHKEIFSAIAIALTLFAFVPYIRSIVSGATKPHVFSWVIWGITTVIAFFAQLEGKGGVGAWPIGVSGTITCGIAVLAYSKRGDIAITKTDWLFFAAAISSLPIWYFTTDPMWAVIMLTSVDLFGFGPTIRKAYDDPNSESLPFYGLFALRNALVVIALERYSLTTVLFPASISVCCVLLMALVLVRRRIVAT